MIAAFLVCWGCADKTKPGTGARDSLADPLVDAAVLLDASAEIRDRGPDASRLASGSDAREMGSHEAGAPNQFDAGAPDQFDAGTHRPLDSGTPNQLDAGAPDQFDAGTHRPLDSGTPNQLDAGITTGEPSGGATHDAQPSAAGDAAPMGMAPLFPLMPQRPACVPDGDLDAGSDDDDAGTHCVPPPPDCVGKPGAAGNTTRMYNGRSYIVHVPPQASPNTPLPMMLVFHGAGGTGAQMQAGTGFDALADQVGIITVYPDGQAGDAPWNVGRNVCPPGNFVSTTQDDLAYVEHIVSDVEADQCVDKRRVFATGFSMGAYFSNELGCRIGRSVLRAIAPHSGGTHPGSCPGAPLPVLLLHGDSDSLINYACGTSARDYWLQRNGCSNQYDRSNVTGGYCDFYKGCPADGQVVMCTFNGLDHAWAVPPMYENAGLLIWLFFSQFW